MTGTHRDRRRGMAEERDCVRISGSLPVIHMDTLDRQQAMLKK